MLAKNMRLSCGVYGLTFARTACLGCAPGRVSKYLGGMYCVVHPPATANTPLVRGHVLSCGQINALTVIAIGLRHAYRYLMNMMLFRY